MAKKKTEKAAAVNWSAPPLEALNETERLAILRTRAYDYAAIACSVPPERQLELLRGTSQPRRDELSKSSESRKLLEQALADNWQFVHSQLPCQEAGPLKGKCTKYACSEGQHYECFNDAQGKILHMKLR